MPTQHVAIVGAGMGGLVAALELARSGFRVTLLERQAYPGGKIRQQEVCGRAIDAGPTVFTMRWVFERIFADAGTTLASVVTLKALDRLARHAWGPGARLDLYADVQRSEDAIGKFAGAKEAKGFREFCARARETYRTLEGPFIRSPQPSPVSLALGSGLRGVSDMWRISPFTTLWRALAEHFADPRLKQLFGRYATYCGSSPFLAPATLMLVAHVEQDGVWIIEGGMTRLAAALAHLAAANGADLRYGCDVKEVTTGPSGVDGVALSSGERITADAVIVNADSAAVANGLLGQRIQSAVTRLEPAQRSLSAVTWTMAARTSGFPLIRHNVFFSSNYEAEFDDIFRQRRLPRQPTIYVCAQDRDDEAAAIAEGPEALLCLVNAPAIGDMRTFTDQEIDQCERVMLSRLQDAGLKIDRTDLAMQRTQPQDFERLFPGTGGALYGAASHGWAASFRRPSAKTKIPGLYLAGGSVHPGPGVPMAALSGLLAAAQLVVDQTSRKP
jgi:1-hydroxycarotenoid 3,4-desaturase